jgi:hypothetical protein
MVILLMAELAVLCFGAVVFVYYLLPTVSQRSIRRFVDKRLPLLSEIFR